MNKKEILQLQEKERKRIAEDFHDTTVQDMVCLSQQLNLIMLYIDRDVTLARLEAASARNQVKRMIGEMRETIFDLRPMMMDNIGWKVSFERLRDKLSGSDPHLKICFDIDEVDCSDGITAISIYRVVCEGCQNVIKHSNADCIHVSVKNKGNFVTICIHDNGDGIHKKKKSGRNHFGLQYMKERVEALSGKMKITSDSFGTYIKVIIPIGREVNV